MAARENLKLPEPVEKGLASLVAFVNLRSDDNDNDRDPSKPIAYDADGNPLFAPRGITFRIPWR